VVFGLGSFDLLTYVAISLLLASVTWVAAYMPARRALGVDPVIALRYD
jgi:ABC-type antimicrobial peptide transport system permease subunit